MSDFSIESIELGKASLPKNNMAPPSTSSANWGTVYQDYILAKELMTLIIC